MLNICTVQPSALQVAATRYVNHRGEEGIHEASDLVEYVVDTMSDFVTPRIPATTGMRVYYSVYLGDGVMSPNGDDQYHYVGATPDEEHMKFVIGFSNEDDPSRRPHLDPFRGDGRTALAPGKADQCPRVQYRHCLQHAEVTTGNPGPEQLQPHPRASSESSPSRSSGTGRVT